MRNNPAVVSAARESIWFSVMAIELLAEEETGQQRQADDDLLIELVGENGVRNTYSLSYMWDKRRIGRWPMLTTIVQQDELRIDRDVYLLSPEKAIKRVYMGGEVEARTHRNTGALIEYSQRILTLEECLRNPAMSHYVEFEAV